MTIPLNDNNKKVEVQEDVRQGIQNFAMFYYQSLTEAGFSMDDAKQRVADLLEKQYNFFCKSGQIPAKSLGSVQRRIEKVTQDVAELAKTDLKLRGIYNDLVAIQAQLKR